MKLLPSELAMLRLAMKGADTEGWARVSAMLWPHFSKLPADLVVKRPDGNAGHVKLTEGGSALVKYS